MDKEYVPIKSRMIDSVPRSIQLEENRAWAWEILDDRDLDLFLEDLLFYIIDNNLLEYLESIYIVDTWFSSHRE